MAAKLGSKCAMISMLGNDAHGRETLENFRSVGVECGAVGVRDEQCSGVASIIVDGSGHNCIVIVPGANDLLTPAVADQHSALISGAKVVLTQLEVPLDATLRAMQLAAASPNTCVVFNPAPAGTSRRHAHVCTYVC
jgi:ribokinase